MPRSVVQSQESQESLESLAERPGLAAVYAAELDYVWRSLRRLGLPASDLEDAAHEVFLVVHRRLGAYDPTRPLRPWIFGIAMRVAAAGRRKVRVHEHEIDDLVDPAPGPEAGVAASQVRDLLVLALSRVPFEQRAVVILHEIDEQPAPEIATALAIPLNTVYSRLRLGRAKLAAEVTRLRAGRNR